MTPRALRLAACAALMLLGAACGHSSPKSSTSKTTTTNVATEGSAATTTTVVIGPNGTLCRTAVFYLGTAVQDATKWHDLAATAGAAKANASLIAATNQIGVALGRKDTVGAKSAATILVAACKRLGVH